MSEAIDFETDIYRWFETQPIWIQVAAALHLEKEFLGATDFDGLANLCKAEANQHAIEADLPTLNDRCLDEGVERLEFRLDSISSIQGVNALKPHSPLHFGGTNMTIIYGGSGSGKSGYVRLLKHMCGARHSGELHGNVFEEKPLPASAHVEISAEATGSAQFEWGGIGQSIPELRRVHIFDTDCANRYVGLPNEAAYEPFLVRFIATLIADCLKVRSVLEAEKSHLISRLPILDSALKDGVYSDWFEKINWATTEAEINRHCSFTSENETELIGLENNLSQIDITMRVGDLTRQRNRANFLADSLQSLQASLSDKVAQQIGELTAEAEKARQNARESANVLFSNSPLKGVGEATWSSMWEAARRYSEQTAYESQPFPVTETGALCVLCQQPLVEGAQRLTRFEAFVKDSLETQAVDAESKASERRNAVPSIPSLENLTSQFEAARSDFGDIQAMHIQLSARHDWVIGQKSDHHDTLVISEIADGLKSLSKGYQAELDALEALKQDQQRTLQLKRLQELRVLRWLSQQRSAIETEIELQLSRHLIDRAYELTGTNALTRKKNDLSETLQAAAHTARFVNELSELGGQRIPIQLTPSRGRQQVKPGFEIALKDAKEVAPVKEVLSEGESRVVALASFLADVTGSPSVVPFVFDDPISSLDQDFEEAVAKRLARECLKRQVIVFTHRLSLLSALDDQTDKIGASCKILALSSNPDERGDPKEAAFQENNPKNALKKLLNDRLPKATSAQIQRRYDDAEVYTKSLCTDIRILSERLIERTLLNDVIFDFEDQSSQRGSLTS